MKKIKTLMIFLLLVMSGAGITVSSQNHESFIQLCESISFSDVLSIEEEEEYIRLFLDGTNYEFKETGKPIVPMYVTTFSFPKETIIEDVVIQFEDIISTSISKKVIPCKEIRDFSQSSKDAHLTALHEDATVYDCDQLFPGMWYDYHIRCGLNDNGFPTTFVTVECYPIQYHPMEQMLFYIKDAEIKITYHIGKQSDNTKSIYDLVIIAPSEFSEGLQPLIVHKNNFGVSTLLKTTEEIYSEYSGLDKPEMIKFFIKDALEQWGIKYVLLVGGLNSYWYAVDKDDSNQGSTDWLIPVRYMNIQHSDETSCISDLYYADIYRYNNDTDEWEFEDWDLYDDNVLANWPRYFGDKDELDLAPDVYVGRLACRNIGEVDTIVDKIIRYESTSPDEKPWLNKMIGIGGKTFEYYEGKPDGEWACDVAIDYMEDVVDDVVRVYTTNNDTGGPRPISKDIVQELSKGAGFVIFQGHGNPMSWNTIWADGDYHNQDWAGGVSIYDYPRLSNAEKLPIVVVGGCHNVLYNVSILQIILNGLVNFDNYWTRNPTPVSFSWGLVMLKRGGAIAATGCTGYGFDRESPIDYSGGLEVNLFYQIGKNGSTTLGQAHSGAIQKYINENAIGQDHAFSITVFQLFGDPSLKIGGYS